MYFTIMTEAQSTAWNEAVAAPAGEEAILAWAAFFEIIRR